MEQLKIKKIEIDNWLIRVIYNRDLIDEEFEDAMNLGITGIRARDKSLEYIYTDVCDCQPNELWWKIIKRTIPLYPEKSRLHEFSYDQLINAIYNKAMNDRRYHNALVIHKISDLRECFKD